MQHSETKQQYWIEYKTDGSIVKVSNREITQSDNKILQTVDTVCRDLLTRKKSKKKHVVLYNSLLKEWFISERLDKVSAKKYTTTSLSEVKDTAKNNSYMHVLFNVSNNTLVVSLNPNKIKDNFKSSLLNSIEQDQRNLFNVYMTRYKSPDNVIETAVVPSKELFEKGSYVVRFSEDYKPEDWQDISIYVPWIFDSYSKEIVNVTDNVHISFDKRQLATVSQQDTADFVLKQLDRRTIRFMLEKTDNVYDIMSMKTWNFIVSDTYIDNFVGAIPVPIHSMIDKRFYDVELTFDMPENPCIIFKNTNYTVRYKGANE